MKMTSNGFTGWLRLSAAAAVVAALFGCVSTQNAIASASGLGGQLQTFATDLLRHLLAARLF